MTVDEATADAAPSSGWQGQAERSVAGATVVAPSR